jgi:hypothetical protein
MWHTPALQRCPRIWSSYSSLKYRKLVKTGFGAACPKPQGQSPLATSQALSRVSRSANSPRPSVINLRQSPDLYPHRHSGITDLTGEDEDRTVQFSLPRWNRFGLRSRTFFPVSATEEPRTCPISPVLSGSSSPLTVRSQSAN